MGRSVTQFKTLVSSVSFLSLVAHPLPQFQTHTHTHPVSHQVLLMWIKYFMEVGGVTIRKVCGQRVLPSEHLVNPVFLLHFYLYHRGPLQLVSLPVTSTPAVHFSYFFQNMSSNTTFDCHMLLMDSKVFNQFSTADQLNCKLLSLVFKTLHEQSHIHYPMCCDFHESIFQSSNAHPIAALPTIYTYFFLQSLSFSMSLRGPLQHYLLHKVLPEHANPQLISPSLNSVNNCCLDEGFFKLCSHPQGVLGQHK